MITPNLFLSGGGDAKQSFVLDTKFFEQLKDNSKILYIPIALNRDGVGFEKCAEWFASIVSRHKRNKEIDFVMFLEGDTIPQLDAFDAIYIGGGNTFKLLDYLTKSGMKEALFDYVQKGNSVYGGSAGAIILGSDINTVEEENDEGYTEHVGFDLLQGYSIICHYHSSLDPKIADYVEKNDNHVLAIPEDGGLIVTGDRIEAVGDVFVFMKGGVKKRFL